MCVLHVKNNVHNQIFVVHIAERFVLMFNLKFLMKLVKKNYLFKLKGFFSTTIYFKKSIYFFS